MIGKLEARTVEATNRRAVHLIDNAARPTRTVTADNGKHEPEPDWASRSFGLPEEER